MYASYNYYESGYLLGRDPKLSEDDFPFWEKQAEDHEASENSGTEK